MNFDDPIIEMLSNGVSLGMHYDTKNPLTPEILTPAVDVDAGYNITFNEKSQSWLVGFYGLSDGYPSTETFVEDESGQRVMLGFKYEKGTPGEKLYGKADEVAFKGVAFITVDKDKNFKNAYLINGDVITELQIVKPEQPSK